jgi:hypothetical protein
VFVGSAVKSKSRAAVLTVIGIASVRFLVLFVINGFSFAGAACHLLLDLAPLLWCQ